MHDLSKQQRRVLILLGRRWQEQGRQPSLSELAEELGMHYVSLKQHLEVLARKNYLSFESQGRGKQPVLRLKETGIPLVGQIAAGSLHGVVEHVEWHFHLAHIDSRNKFALRVKGDSMSELILDGDVVILEQRPYRSGEICAVRHGDETTLKYLDLYLDGSALLRPHNPEYDAIEVNLADIQVTGVFHSLLRGPITDELFQEVVLN
jgi:SOS regulatory protein LexA